MLLWTIWSFPFITNGQHIWIPILLATPHTIRPLQPLFLKRSLNLASTIFIIYFFPHTYIHSHWTCSFHQHINFPCSVVAHTIISWKRKTCSKRLQKFQFKIEHPNLNAKHQLQFNNKTPMIITPQMNCASLLPQIVLESPRHSNTQKGNIIHLYIKSK